MNKRDTKGVIISVVMLVCIGILMVYSSTVLMSMRKYGNSFHYLLNHVFTVFVGIIAMIVLSRLDYQGLRRPLFHIAKFRVSSVHVLMAIALISLFLVFVPGVGVSANGARRWLRLWPTTFQPSEFVKLVMVIFLADYMDKNLHRMKDVRYGILIPVGVMLSFQGVIIFQPDFGAVMSLGILTIGLMILGGVRLRYIGCMLLLAVPVAYKLAASASYRVKRITCFTDPWKEPLGCGFQLVQSFIAFGNGGISGLGLGGSKQKLYFLPEVHTDFIFSLIGEELGLIGAAAVLVLFLYFFIKGVKIANKTKDSFGYFLTLGLTLMIGVQVLINFAVTTGLMPTKGLPLPFISYGGSSLLINLAAVGILISISRKNESRTESQTPADGFSLHEHYMFNRPQRARR
ncbi:MAG: putative lipid II flippase FtsW [Nitrospirae bacterium]|nr:putative lipid II flippase FtsW [Nitrospirota bacterium]